MQLTTYVIAGGIITVALTQHIREEFQPELRRAKVWVQDRQEIVFMVCVVAMALVLAGAFGEGLQRTIQVLAK